MKITKSKLQKIIHEAIDEVADDDYRASQQQEYEKLEKSLEYQGSTRFMDPGIVNPTKVRDNSPELWTLLGQAWAIMGSKNPSHSEIFNITASISRAREYQMEKWGLSDEEKQILMNAYEQSQALLKATPTHDRGYGKGRYQGD
jgi:hypothetical protein